MHFNGQLGWLKKKQNFNFKQTFSTGLLSNTVRKDSIFTTSVIRKNAQNLD